jgi:alkanesulfonate monooxygenase SsuD/methylene tetrahydromethanopterin reductase-like flavin-dependent oxidoreductase (luciferase family)
MEIASVARMFPGRAEIGLGHGVREWMTQVGAQVESPMTLLREYTGAVQALLAGDEVTVAGRYVRLDGVRLAWAPRSTERPRLHVGAVGPRTVALAGEVGDGLVLTGGTTPDRLRAQRERYDAARGQRAGRVTVYLVCVTGPDSARRYDAELRRWNLDPADEAGVGGDAAAVAAMVQRLADAGADSVVLQPPDDEDPVEFARFAGSEVRPLLA